MQKKLLIIKGSPRKNGITASICSVAENAENVEVSVFDTYFQDFKACCDCRKCTETEKCVFNDLNGFFEEFESADVLVFASPVYNGGFSAPMKALLDRFQVYFNRFYKNGKTQPVAKKRKAILVSASGRAAQEEFFYMKKYLQRAFTVLNITPVGAVLCENTDTAPDLNKAVEEFTVLLKRSLDDE